MKNLLLVSILLGCSAALADGKQLLESQCMECHVVDGRGGTKQAAPPMYAVWHHYRQAYPEKEAFVAAMSKWLKQPSREGSEMKGAIKKFGLMPRQEISEEQVQSVAEYIYERSFELPNWYITHYKNKHGTKEHGYDDGDKSASQHEQ